MLLDLIIIIIILLAVTIIINVFVIIIIIDNSNIIILIRTIIIIIPVVIIKGNLVALDFYNLVIFVVASIMITIANRKSSSIPYLREWRRLLLKYNRETDRPYIEIAYCSGCKRNISCCAS